LQHGEVEAVVSNKAMLGHMLKECGWKDLSVLPHTLVVEDYALLLPSGSPLREAINRAVLPQGRTPKTTQRHHGS
jgi:hypothetical protein